MGSYRNYYPGAINFKHVNPSDSFLITGTSLIIKIRFFLVQNVIINVLFLAPGEPPVYRKFVYKNLLQLHRSLLFKKMS
jgi:hypothetical protein